MWQTKPWCVLLQERKELIGKKLNEQHSNWGSLLLGLGVTISVAGGFNTFLRTGESLTATPGGRREGTCRPVCAARR